MVSEGAEMSLAANMVVSKVNFFLYTDFNSRSRGFIVLLIVFLLSQSGIKLRQTNRG